MNLQAIENPYYPLSRIYVANCRLHPRRHKRGAYVCTASLILNLCIKWRRVVTFTLRPLWHQIKSSPCPRTVWTFRRSEKSLTSDVNRAPVLPGIRLITTQSGLAGLCVASYYTLCSYYSWTCHYWRTGQYNRQDKLKRNKHGYEDNCLQEHSTV